MKTAEDPRHIKRIKTVKALFAESFAPQDDLPNLAKKVLSQKNTIEFLGVWEKIYNPN